MAQPSAQREPSMEEILASIRRIIEDSDNGRKPEEADVMSEDEMDAEANAPEAFATPEAFTTKEIASFRAELSEDDRTPLAPARLTLAEIGEAVHSRAEPSVVDIRREPEPAGRPSVEPRNAWKATPAESPVEVSADAEDEIPVEASHEVTQPIADTARGIISDRAGRQVAAAFEELSEVFAASRKRSFDEMAEEMMRPMLQDWLDNNLPLLVERLVREEIERVARGSSR